MMNLVSLSHCPIGWRISTIGESANIANNLRFPISEAERASISGPFPYYGPTGILAWINEARIDGEYMLIGEDGDHFLKFRDRQMTLLVSGQFNVNNHAHLVRGRNECTTKWLFYFFMHADLTPFLTRQGVGRFKLTKAALSELPVHLPPLPEQRKIADILSTWDESLKTLDALIAAKTRQKQALMQQLLTGKTRVKGAKGGIKFVRASELFTNRSERNTNGLPILSVTQDQGVVLRSSLDRRIGHDEETNGSYKVVRKGDFVISLRSFQGGLEYSEIEGAVSPAYHIIHPRCDLDCLFFKHYFKSADFVSRLATAVIGIRDGKQISFTDFGFIKLPFPPVEDQRRIGILLDTADQELTLLRTQRQTLDQQKRGLMQRLLTGKIRVNFVKSFDKSDDSPKG